MDNHQIAKILSANDSGQTGAHQAGILIPKRPEILSFFPMLDGSTKNPRQSLLFWDEEEQRHWQFEFIYYNGKFFDGTRNEYRLTQMTTYLRTHGLAKGDELVMTKDELDRRKISFIKQATSQIIVVPVTALKLGGGWRVIRT